MENALVKAPAPKLSLIGTLAAKYNVEPGKFLATLKATVMPKRQGGEPVQVSDEELAAFCMVCHQYDLNPFLKEIYAYPNRSGGITAVVGVDGWCKLINRRSDYDGITFTHEDNEGKPFSVTAKIHVKDRSYPIEVTEYFSECHRGTDNWNKSPRRMLRHRALIQCARVAFGFGGIHDEDDALAMAVNVTPAAEKRDKVKFRQVSAPVDEVTPEPTATTQGNPDPAPAWPTVQDSLAAIIQDAGFTLGHFNAFVLHEGESKVDFSTWDDVPDDLATKMVKGKTNLIAGIKAMEGGSK